LAPVAALADGRHQRLCCTLHMHITSCQNARRQTAASCVGFAVAGAICSAVVTARPYLRQAYK
jgi:hypothetical protein